MTSTTARVAKFGTQSGLSWQSIGDPIMGGCSQGALEAVDDETGAFIGQVSLANGGGFASVKADLATLDLSGYHGLRLDVQGDGHTYKLGLRTSHDRKDPVYQQAFDTHASEWQILHLPFDGFVATQRGRLLPDAPPLKRSHIASLSLFISNRQAGPFRLLLREIAAYSNNLAAGE